MKIQLFYICLIASIIEAIFILSLIYFSFFNILPITPSFTLKKKEKLKSRKVIQKLFKDGKSFSNFPIRVIYLPVENQDSTLKAGFTVSTKYFKNAVDRNRVKRLMRESYRLQKNNLVNELIKNNQQLAVFFIYTSGDLPKYQEVFEKSGILLDRIEKTISTNKK
ncbi:MAG: ribonuclease P protein component [Ginsengibacter sp.]